MRSSSSIRVAQVIAPFLALIFALTGCATDASKPVTSFQSSREAVRWLASTEGPSQTAPGEIRIFEGSSKDSSSGRAPVPLLRVRSSHKGVGQQVFERCEIDPVDFAGKREGAPVGECRALGNPDGYTQEQISALLSESVGKSLGPDWDAIKINLAAAGPAAVGAAMAFIVDPTKLLAFALTGLAVGNGSAAAFEARRANVLDKSSAMILRLDASQSGFSVITIQGSLHDHERILRLALKQIDKGKKAMEEKLVAPPLPAETRIDLVPFTP